MKLRFPTTQSAFPAAAITLIVAGGTALGWWLVVETDQELRSQILLQARTAAGAINAEALQALNGSENDAASAQYRILKKQLASIREADPKCRFVYLMGQKSDGRVFFFADSEPAGSPDESPPGQIYQEISPEDRDIFRTKTARVTGPASDRWGTWVTALVPLNDPMSGRLTAVLGMDVDARDWNRNVAARAAFPNGVLLLLSLCLLAAITIALSAARRNAGRSGASLIATASEAPTAPTLAEKLTMSRLLLGMGLLGVAFLAVVLYQTTHWSWEHINRTAQHEAALAVALNSALRDYVAEHIRPELEKRVQSGEFIPEAMSSSFISRRIFEKAQAAFPEAVVRFPSRNPRNPLNRATPAEENIIRFFEQNPDAPSWTGTIRFSQDGEEYMARALPRRFTSECMRCHGEPQDAPASLVERYGPIAGFGHSVGDVSLDLAAIPISAARAEAASDLRRHMIWAAILCLLFIAGTAGLVWLDLAQRRSAEERLRVSEEKHRLLFHHALSGIGVHRMVRDASGRPVDYIFLDANPAFETHTGLRVGDILGKRVTEVIPGIEKTGLIELYGRTVATGEPLNFEQFVEPLGRHYAISVYRIAEEQFATVFSNITERKEAETRLKEQNNLLQTILDGIPDVIALKTSDHTVLSYNKAGYEMLGLSHEQVTGRKCYELLGCVQPCENCPTLESTATGKVTTSEIFFSQFERWIRATSIPIRDDSGNIALVVEQLHDITKEKHAEQELKGTVEALASANRTLEEFYRVAESATRAKSEFLANMSHEIRTPLTAILGFTDILIRDPRLEQGPTDWIDALRTIHRNGEHLLQLINDILDLSKIEAGRLEVERIACSPPQLLADVISLMRVRAAAKNLQLNLQFAGKIPETIQSDPLRLRQILINLIGNAVKFTEKGEVRVVARLVQDADRPSLLQIDVIDTGIGLTDEQISRLFQPFSQGDSSTTRKYGGSGLGLTISKRLAEMLGGDITCRSSPGNGSTFTLTVATGDISGVALLESPEEGVAASRKQREGLAVPLVRLQGRILLAEDGPDNRRLISFILERAGAEVTLVENGQAAFDTALAARDRGEPFDLILMDMQMPVMDGYTATARLRDAGYAGPIVALTAHAMEGDDVQCRQAGCDDYLTKPIDRAKFLATIARILEARRTATAPIGPEEPQPSPEEAPRPAT